ncbi:PA14 domain-containing protein, partial [Streptomyces parvulus]|uniref:PA14 domain-containing protein n=1 Tax=Streptomyces parvulus TaxID=146923 RepID=UPI003F4BC5B0
MYPRLYPRRPGGRLAGTLIGSLLAIGLTATPAPADPPAPAEAAAAEALPPQEPGVTLRTFDTQVPLNDICTLKPGQTPNVDKLMPVIDWSAPADFGLESNFVTHVLGNLHAPGAGSYTLRLTSDDGSRLWIDDRLVIDLGGLHGP